MSTGLVPTVSLWVAFAFVGAAAGFAAQIVSVPPTVAPFMAWIALELAALGGLLGVTSWKFITWGGA